MAKLTLQSLLKQAQKMNNDYNNSARNAADRANQFTHNERIETQKYNSAEALKSRQWQEQMSNTAHQREVADLQAAGLNPILSANNGAAVTSGATASSSSGSGISEDISNMVDKFVNLANNVVSNQTQLAATALNNDVTKYGIDKNYLASIYGASSSAAASRYASELGLYSTKYATDHQGYKGWINDPQQTVGTVAEWIETLWGIPKEVILQGLPKNKKK